MKTRQTAGRGVHGRKYDCSRCCCSVSVQGSRRDRSIQEARRTAYANATSEKGLLECGKKEASGERKRKSFRTLNVVVVLVVSVVGHEADGEDLALGSRAFLVRVLFTPDFARFFAMFLPASSTLSFILLICGNREKISGKN